MAKSKDRDVFFSSDHPGPLKALLFELKGKRDAEDGTTPAICTEMLAALSIEEVIAYMRNRRSDFEIVELKILGKVQVLSSSEHLV
jgi:hypothetical protein